MAGISSISGLSSLSEDLYYQYLINNNSTSTMLNALSGDTSQDNSGSLAGAVGSGLYGLNNLSSLGSLYGLDNLSDLGSLYGLNSLNGLDGLLGSSDEALLGASQSISSFSNILEVYLNAQRTEAAQMSEQLSEVLEEAAETENVSSLTYRTVQEIYQYFLEKTASSSSGAATGVQQTSSGGQPGGNGMDVLPVEQEIDFDALEQKLMEEAESRIPVAARYI